MADVFGKSETLSRGVNSFGAAVGDLFAAEGLEASAEGYRQAAAFSRTNLGFTEESIRIKKLMADREIYKALGGQENDIATSGLAASGSALDIMRDSAQQGELTRQMLDLQGKIQVTTLKQQIAAYETQANAAEDAAEGKLWSAGINAVSAVVSLGSFGMGG
jgi:hypothetical protein